MSRMEKGIAGILVFTTLVLALLFALGEGLIHHGPGKETVRSESAVTPPDPMEPAALNALEEFFEAPDIVTKAALVRDSERVLPLMRDYHERRGHPFPSLGRVSPGKPAQFDETPMVLFEVEPFTGPRYPVAVVWDGRRFAIDWESLTAYGTIDWNEFLESKPAAPHTMRVFIRAADESEQIPGAPNGGVTYMIEHRDDPQPVLVIARSEVAMLLKPLVDRHRVPVTLEAAWKPLGPGGMPVPEILRLVAPTWAR